MIVLLILQNNQEAKTSSPYSPSSFLTTLFHLRFDSGHSYYDSPPLELVTTHTSLRSHAQHTASAREPTTSTLLRSLQPTTSSKHSTQWASFLLPLPTLPLQPPAPVPSPVQSTSPPSTAPAWPPPRTATPTLSCSLSLPDQTATSSTRPSRMRRSPTPSVSRSAWRGETATARPCASGWRSMSDGVVGTRRLPHAGTARNSDEKPSRSTVTGLNNMGEVPCIWFQAVVQTKG